MSHTPFLQTAGGGALGGAAISAAAGLIGSIGSGRKAYHRSKKLMDKQFAMDKEMYDYQNKYNLPSAQMARLKAAGLNPALMYGQGTTGNASNQPQSKFTQLNPYMQAGDIGQLANAGVQLALANAQKKNIDSQTQKNTTQSSKDKAEIKLINAKVPNMTQDTAMKLQQTSNLKTVNDYDKLRVEFEKEVVQRAKKGIIKGDTIGNVLTMFGLDPMNNENHRNWLYGALLTWFGSGIVKNIMSVLPWNKLIPNTPNMPKTKLGRGRQTGSNTYEW